MVVIDRAPRTKALSSAYAHDHVPMVTVENFKGIQKSSHPESLAPEMEWIPVFPQARRAQTFSVHGGAYRQLVASSVGAKGGCARHFNLERRGAHRPRRGGRDEDLLACRLTRAGCSGLAPRLRLGARR